MINWKHFDLNAAENYNSIIVTALLDGTFLCSDSFWTLVHKDDIDDFYDTLMIFTIIEIGKRIKALRRKSKFFKNQFFFKLF